MFRYKKFNYLANSFQVSKCPVYSVNSLVNLQSVSVQLGHLKPNITYPEHGLLLTELAGQVPNATLIKHGKRLKSTIILNASLCSMHKWRFLDKLLHVIMPLASDMKVCVIKSGQRRYNWRWRYFFEWSDVDPLLTDRVMRKDVYLPLFINISFSRPSISCATNEQTVRMFRLPFTFIG